MEILPIIKTYLPDKKDILHRYASWDNCYNAFNVSAKSENHSLELAFYLASWGMYRGSSGLLQKNHLIHKEAVSILFSGKNQRLKCNKNNEVTRNDIEDILALKKELATHYSSISFVKGKNPSIHITPTDTLLSKIILGTLGCVPAYDRYFNDGLKEMGMSYNKFNGSSLNELFDFIDKHRTDIDEAQQYVKTVTEKHYPIMKIMDMFFWQIGYSKFLRENSLEENN